ncbi:hypothetical protein WUBG_00614 [Wuchereria bancrofti]|uniref:Uncharacterized protein n=1 Tax=Wuchereria bancrofti TaxID=6293 RepID=J9FM57_WUCBA|nr:hypothetical protein WUBG_00614 [Wuchereria bancrofti]
MQSSAKRRFVDTYLNEVGDMRNTVNRLQLYEIAIAAGKDLLISDLGATEPEIEKRNREIEVFYSGSSCRKFYSVILNPLKVFAQNLRNGYSKV